ncbi:MAG TPA: YbhB/YbcL family Raf kinase inhibitor-like protein [Candidatus Paceibacterota bacterium]
MRTLQVTSSSFANTGIIPKLYTYDGKNINPPLRVDNIPSGTQTLAFIMDDPDAPGGTWVHWIEWNMDTAGLESFSILEGRDPVGISGSGTSGHMFYEGPCPPSGTHRYFFKFYALDTILELSAGSGKDALEQAMTGHIIGRGEIIGLYTRS